MSFVFACFGIVQISFAISQPDFTYIGQFEAQHPSFVELIDLSPSSGSHSEFDLDLVITTFEEFGEGNGVYTFPNIGLQLENISSGIAPSKTVLVNHTLTWPNLVYISEANIFAAETTMIIHDGFLTPFHSNGGVYALLINNTVGLKLIRLNPKLKDCYYHNSTMIDMNGDGLLDLLLAQTCQHKHVNTGTLIWLQQPETNPETPGSWIPQTLTDGPDVLITTQILNETTVIVYAAQFFTKCLKYYYLIIGVDTPYIVDRNGTLIDDTIGPVYDVTIVDMFKNGEKQLLVNDHDGDGSVNGVWLYEFPKDFPSNHTFVKHQIAYNFNTTGGTGVGAPGFVKPFDINPKQDVEKPFKIGVAGDGNYIAWELVLMNETSFIYKKNIIRSVGGTSGMIAFGDVNGDGYTEAFIPFYEDGLIYVYTTNPEGL